MDKKEIEEAAKLILDNLQDIDEPVLIKLNRASWAEIKIKERIKKEIEELKKNGTTKKTG